MKIYFFPRYVQSEEHQTTLEKIEKNIKILFKRTKNTKFLQRLENLIENQSILLSLTIKIVTVQVIDLRIAELNFEMNFRKINPYLIFFVSNGSRILFTVQKRCNASMIHRLIYVSCFEISLGIPGIGRWKRNVQCPKHKVNYQLYVV